MSIYRNSDLGLSAALTCRGHNLKAVDHSAGQRAFFLFEQSEALLGDVSAYWSDELTLSPRLYFQAVRSLKARLYNETS